MSDVLEWLAKNQEWAFSGIGVVAVGALWASVNASRRYWISRNPAPSRPEQRAWLNDLCGFCAEVEATMTEMFVVRRREQEPGSDEALRAFAALQRLDASAQKLQLQAAALFKAAEVRDHLFELVRRVSLAKQALMFVNKECLGAAFAADLEWVQAQVRRTIASTAVAADYRMDAESPPLLVGFLPSYDVPEDDYSDQPPSSRIASRFSIERAKLASTAAGRSWGPTDIADIGNRPTLNPQVSPSEFVSQEQAALAKARRTSAEVRRDKKAESYAIPFWQEVTCELDGTRGTSRVRLVDGSLFRLTVKLSMRVKFPVRVSRTWQAGVKEKLSPIVSDGAQDVLRALTFIEVRNGLPRLQEELIARMTLPFEEHGYVIMSLHIREMERVG